MIFRPTPAALGSLLLMAGCTTYQPAYYGPASYATPPVSIAPPMQVAPPLITSAPLPAPGTFLPDRPPMQDPYASLPPVEEPPVRDAPPPALDASPAGPPDILNTPPAILDSPQAGSDPVTDLLLSPQRSPQSPPETTLSAPPGVTPAPAPAPISKSRGAAAESAPLMGFRPMRGQTAPTP